MAERVLTERELNRALLARQGLLERGKGSIPRTLERMGGLQAQYAPSMYVGLWSRIEDLQRDALTRALARRSVVQGTLLRSTIHLVPKGDYWPWALAVREARRAGWARTPWRQEVTPKALAAAARGVAKRFGGREFEVKELNAALEGRRPQVSVWRNGIMLWLDLVRVPPSGTWERRRAETPAPVRFLPTWDATLLVHARRTQILPERHRSKVFNIKTPQSVSVFLAGGQVAGTWRFEKGKVTTKPFTKLDAATKRELEAEADRLADFHA